jgi:hypothetical protein
MSAQSAGVAPPGSSTQQKQADKHHREDEQRVEQALVDQTADQQTIRTGIFPAPGFLRRFAKAR